MSHGPLLVYLQAILPSLNPAQRLIAKYVLEDPERTLSSSIGNLHRGSGASVGSIMSFCRSLGVKGFADFKIALARELSQGGFSASQKPVKKTRRCSRMSSDSKSRACRKRCNSTRRTNWKRSRALLSRRGALNSFPSACPILWLTPPVPS